MQSDRRMRRACLLLIGAATLALCQTSDVEGVDIVEGSGAPPVPRARHAECDDGGERPCATAEPPLVDSAEESEEGKAGAPQQRKKVYVIERRGVYDWSGYSVFGGFRS